METASAVVNSTSLFPSFGVGPARSRSFPNRSAFETSPRYTPLHRQLAAKGVVIQQNLRYVDNHRKELKKRWTTFDDYKQNYEVPRSLIDEILAEGEKQNIKPKDEAELEKTLPYLSLQLKALIARDLWDMSEYFSVFNESSEMVKKALEVISL